MSNDGLLLKRLGKYMRPHLFILIAAAVCLFLRMGLDLYRPVILKHTIDDALPAHDVGLLTTYSMYYAAAVGISMVALFAETYLLRLFGQKVIYEIRNIVFAKLSMRSPEDFDAVPAGNLVTRVTNDTESLRTLYTEVVLKIFSSLFMIIGIMVSMFMLNHVLGIAVAILLPVMGAIIFIYQKYARRAFRRVRTQVAASNGGVQELLNFIVIVKSYLGEKKAEATYGKVNDAFLEAGLFEVKTFAVFRPIVDFLFFLGIITVLWVTNVSDSITEAGTVFACLQYLNKLFVPLKDIAEKYNSLQSSLAGAERLVPVLLEPSDLPHGEAVVPPEFATIESITFEHVRFRYSNADEFALKDIDFEVKGGEFLGIAGPSGSGKTTIAGLLAGFMRPTEGRILINGRDTAAYSPRVLRECIGYVFQDSHLFKGTIRDNLSLYDDSLPSEALEAAAKKAGLHDMIMRMPDGYDTSVGYLGSLLSTGQRQLLALARTLVKDRPILILDEATAHIDGRTEETIRASVESVRGEKTVIAVAHRLAGLRTASNILFIRDGRIEESGTFEELVASGGAFADMWAAGRTEEQA